MHGDGRRYLTDTHHNGLFLLVILTLRCCAETVLRLCQYACSCMPLTARPLGSFIRLNVLSHARASAVLHATLGTLGTQAAALSLGKWLANSDR